jgi:hypothetical protein
LSIPSCACFLYCKPCIHQCTSMFISLTKLKKKVSGRSYRIIEWICCVKCPFLYSEPVLCNHFHWMFWLWSSRLNELLEQHIRSLL